jgi:hypothetical protein
MVYGEWINSKHGKDKHNEIYTQQSSELNFSNYYFRLLIRTNNTKFLGLELDKNVNWENHIQKFLLKLSSA